MLLRITVLSLLPIFCACEDLFWLTTELVSVEWRKGCLTTGGCAEPRFKLTETNMASNEQVSISWSILHDFNQDQPRTFVSSWKRGLPTDVALLCEVVGTDPTYGFPRICDATANTQIFPKETSQHTFTRVRRAEDPESGKGKLVVELTGKCFNASLTVEKHEERCPWCQEEKQEEPLAFVLQPEAENINSTVIPHYFAGGEQLLCIAVTVLAGIAIISTAAFACLLIAFIKQKRTPPAKCRVGVFPSGGIRVDPIRIGDDCRYEMPWDQKYRPLPHWLSNRSDTNSSSPNGSSSSTSGPLCYQTSTTTVGGMSRYESPTSLPGRHDDSGLESV